MSIKQLRARQAIAASVMILSGGMPGFLFASPAIASPVSVFSEPAWHGPLTSEVRNSREELHSWLVGQRVQSKSATGFSIELSPNERAQIGQTGPALPGVQPVEKRLRVGISKTVDQEIRFDGNGIKGGTNQPGASRVSSGRLVWTALVTSAKATALRLHLKGFHLPQGAALYFYNDAGQAFGPYTGSGPMGTGEFWTHTVFGATAFLQLHYEGEVTPHVLKDLRFTLASIGHIGPRFRLARHVSPSTQGKAFCEFNANCVENASCYGSEDWSAIDQARGGVAEMLFASGPWQYLCSGGLLADTDTGTQIPYFLTANHCLSTDSEASSLETYFGYTTPCDGDYTGTDCSIPDPYSTLGASILSTNSTSDYTLMELSQQPPTGAVFLGWTNTDVAFSAGTDLYRISHPQGGPQAYSEHVVDTDRGACRVWPRGDWIYSTDVLGATEGGSSGSPVLNASGQVVGQLSGACGTNTGDVCDATNNATVDGALAAYYPEVAQFLDPGDGGGDPPAEVQASVADITVSTRNRGPWTNGVATVTVVDANGSPVPNATVSGDFSGDVSGSGSATTDSNGVAVIESDRTRSGINTLQFCVSDVTGSGISYDPAANAEDCDSLGDGGGGGTTEDVTVADVQLSTRSRGPWNNGVATVTVVDSSNNPVPNATVSGDFSGDVSGSDSSTTDSNGVAVLESDRTRDSLSSFDFCVKDVTGTGISYVPGTEACGS